MSIKTRCDGSTTPLIVDDSHGKWTTVSTRRNREWHAMHFTCHDPIRRPKPTGADLHINSKLSL